jgi:hypothetical protein
MGIHSRNFFLFIMLHPQLGTRLVPKTNVLISTRAMRSACLKSFVGKVLKFFQTRDFISDLGEISHNKCLGKQLPPMRIIQGCYKLRKIVSVHKLILDESHDSIAK